MSVPAFQSRLRALNFDLDSPSYVVRAGETGASIAYRYRLSEQELARLNPGVDIQRLAPGMEVYVREPYQPRPRATANRSGFTASQGEFAASAQRYEDARSYGDVRGYRDARGYGDIRGYEETGRSVVAHRLPSARTSPTLRAQPQVIAGTAVSDRTLLGSSNDYANSLPPMRVGTYDDNSFPVEELVSNEYQIPGDGLEGNDEAIALDNGLSTGGENSWRWPTGGRVTRTFNPGRPNGRAIDIAGMVGQDVVAVSDGRVIFAGRDPSNVGKVVIVKHANDYVSVYSHTKDLFVSTNDTVEAGDTIASLGANPDEESMLRFELRRGGEPVDPLRRLPPQ